MLPSCYESVGSVFLVQRKYFFYNDLQESDFLLTQERRVLIINDGGYSFCSHRIAIWTSCFINRIRKQRFQ